MSRESSYLRNGGNLLGVWFPTFSIKFTVLEMKKLYQSPSRFLIFCSVSIGMAIGISVVDMVMKPDLRINKDD